MSFFQKPFRKFRNGFFVFVAVAATGFSLSAQFKFREPPNRTDPDPLGEAAGELVWNWFLQNRAIGSFILEGDLVHRPTAEASKRFGVTLQGNWTTNCQRTRITLESGNGGMVSREILSSPEETRVADPEAEDQGSLVLEGDSWHEPIFPMLPFTWNDLLMPYLHWDDVAYLGPDRYLGRPAHRYQLHNPDPDAFPQRVIVTLDEDFAALLKADFFNTENKLQKRLRIGGFSKFNNEWMFSELNWENRAKRETVRLEVYSFSNSP